MRRYRVCILVGLFLWLFKIDTIEGKYIDTMSCLQCANVSVKLSMDEFSIHGNLTIFKHDMKTYLKDCCLRAYFIGASNNILSTNNKAAILSSMKVKIPKYVAVGDETFKIYELIKPKSQSVVMVSRSINLNECPIPYSVMTKSEYTHYMNNILKQQKATLLIQQDEPMTDATPHFVYLIRDRTAIAANQPIYKIGKTTQPNFDRFKGYPKGYEIILHMACENCHITETAIIALFKSKYLQIVEYGSEYFMGDAKSMMTDICHLVLG